MPAKMNGSLSCRSMMHTLDHRMRMNALSMLVTYWSDLLQGLILSHVQLQAVERAGTSISYGQLLHEMHRSLKTLSGGQSGGGGGMGGMLGGGGGGGGFMGKVINVGTASVCQHKVSTHHRGCVTLLRSSSAVACMHDQEELQ